MSSSSARPIVAMLLVAVLAAAFWILLLGPKRQEASDLGNEVEQLQAGLAQAQSAANEAIEAQKKFPSDYRQLVLLGKAVPAGDDTSSLLVQVNQIAEQSDVKFESILLSNSSTGEAETGSAAAEVPLTGTSATGASTPVPPSEKAASLLPLGATIGTAGLGVMPYSLTFTGDFFQVADFIKGIDSLVHTGESEVSVDGRLITLNGFSLNESAEGGFPKLDAKFSVTTYLVPPGEGLTIGASSAAPAEAEPTPSSSTTR